MLNTVLFKHNPETNKPSVFNTLSEWLTRNIKVSHLLIFLFAYTAFSKLQFFSNSQLIDLADFEKAMFKSPVLRPYVHELAYLIPLSEIVVCLLLIFNKTKKWGYFISLGLLAVFTGYITYILIVYSHHLPCVCGGVISQMSWPVHLLFNLFYMAITIRAIFLMNKKQQ
ncbi:MauE/DoxX family redox-associated membrane protein [Niastella sp. OAS944]|uniref:MauE/DoxX family redox-associated membrane protein n=1 Tax=Niastella sp. OAS944 TaxID=2664089 RepID=UPI00347D7821|nr:hypothetical protein [Chitinophagaceae bacterium OAS944]